MKFLDEHPGLLANILIVLLIDIFLYLATMHVEGFAIIGVIIYYDIPLLLFSLILGGYLANKKFELGAPWLLNLLLIPLIQMVEFKVVPKLPCNQDQDGDVIYEFTHDEEDYFLDYYTPDKTYSLHHWYGDNYSYILAGNYKDYYNARKLIIFDEGKKKIYDSIPGTIQIKDLYIQNGVLYGLFYEGVKIKESSRHEAERLRCKKNN